MDHIVRTFDSRLGRACAQTSCLLVLICLIPALLKAQTPDPAPEMERPVPVLTGNAGFFTNVNGGETELVPSVTPVLLLPLGDRWLVESRAESKANSNGTGEPGPMVEGWSRRSTTCNWTTLRTDTEDHEGMNMKVLVVP